MRKEREGARDTNTSAASDKLATILTIVRSRPEAKLPRRARESNRCDASRSYDALNAKHIRRIYPRLSPSRYSGSRFKSSSSASASFDFPRRKEEREAVPAGDSTSTSVVCPTEVLVRRVTSVASVTHHGVEKVDAFALHAPLSAPRRVSRLGGRNLLRFSCTFHVSPTSLD